MEEDQCGHHLPSRPVDATDSLEREPKLVSKERKIRPGKKWYHVNFRESAGSTTRLCEGDSSKAAPRLFHDQDAVQQVNYEVGYLYNKAC
jgi:hypothetical protein